MGDTARPRQTLPWLLSLVSSLLLLDNAFADCAPRFGPPGPLLTTIILPDDRRALESLLEEKVDEVTCAFMERRRRFLNLRPYRGFLVLTSTRIVLVRDNEKRDIVFDTALSDLRRIGWSYFPSNPWPFPPFPQSASNFPASLWLEREADAFSFQVPCAEITIRFVRELERRAITSPHFTVAPGTTPLTCN